jgi:hypothetical protein
MPIVAQAQNTKAPNAAIRTHSDWRELSSTASEQAK